MASATSLGTTGTAITLTFSVPVEFDGTQDPGAYSIRPLDGGAPLEVLKASATTSVLASGSTATITADPSGISQELTLPGGSFSGANIGQYIVLNSTHPVWNPPVLHRIVSVSSSTVVEVAGPLYTGDPTNGSIPWQHISAVTAVVLTTNKATNSKSYVISFGFRAQAGTPYVDTATLVAAVNGPQVTFAIGDGDFAGTGEVVVLFDQPMKVSPTLTDPAQYVITGPSSVSVLRAFCVSDFEIILETSGIINSQVGFVVTPYFLTVNASGPNVMEDLGGNPLDSGHNSAQFVGILPILDRSIFTDRGPIAKPPLEIASGSTGSILNFTDVRLPNGISGGLPTSVVGLYVTLSSSPQNAGTYLIVNRLSGTDLRLNASFRIPDTSDGSITWSVFDPRSGQIADDPSDVTVLVNSSPVTVNSVIGLLGQIILAETPAPGSDISINYSWVQNPTVDFRGLNSAEFVLNSEGSGDLNSQHHYRYNANLVQPESFVAEDIQGVLSQPLSRKLHYRAYERAYTAGLNDPNLLVLNTPNHQIASPPLTRPIPQVSVEYNANDLGLPENDPISPWERKGTGTAQIVNGELIVTDTTSGPFPTGQPIFWTRPVDVTYPHVFAEGWRMSLNATPVTEGVFTGVAAGWSTDLKAVVVGYLLDGGVAKIGFLKKGLGDASYDIESWTGGVDNTLTSTDLPMTFDWSIVHSYRLFKDLNNIIRLYIDGEVVESLRITEDELPYLEELAAPFDRLEGVYFGSLSGPATSTSTWDFLQYGTIPTNPEQFVPAIFVQYEGTSYPQDSTPPWTPVGFHGTETIIGSDYLLLDSTSATTQDTSIEAGLIGGDFHGYARIEPLLSVSSSVDVDFGFQGVSYTHGISPNALMCAVDDGTRLVQVSFLSSNGFPKFSYPGRSLPEDATPNAWTPTGGATAQMMGRALRISDTSVSDGLVYSMDDLAAGISSDRILSPGVDYAVEFRVKVLSHTSDPSGFAGVSVETFDGNDLTTGRVVGILLRDSSGTKTVAFHSEGTLLGPSDEFPFNWDDQFPHTYRLIKNTQFDLISLFIDGVFIGSVDYTDFNPGSGNPSIVWGSATAASVAAISEVEWSYVNTWRFFYTSTIPPTPAPDITRRYVGIWRGTTSGTLLDYHLPTKVRSVGTFPASNTLQDLGTDFGAAGVIESDHLLIPTGPNQGEYQILEVFTNAVEIVGTFPVVSATAETKYSIPTPIDWTTAHQYRILRVPQGAVSLTLDSSTVPAIVVDYSDLTLPASYRGLPWVISEGLPSVVFGAFDPQNLSESKWDYVRYGVTSQIGGTRILPDHMVLNQRNVMASPEHLTTSIPHTHTDYWSSSTGIPPKLDPDLFQNSGLAAFTVLNEGTPLVPSTQTFEVRRPTPVTTYLSALNQPEDVLNTPGFILNNGAVEVNLVVPPDVLYNALDVIEQSTGETNLLAPFSDEDGIIDLGVLSWQNEVCLKYTADTLPENDPTAQTPWSLVSITPSDVTVSDSAGILSYSVGGIGANTLYRNPTTLPDSISLPTTVTFRFKVVTDATGGTGDSSIRVGFSGLGMTVLLAFVTSSLGERLVEILDGPTQNVLGALPFDFLDGSTHTYRLVRDPTVGQVQFFIDS